MKTTTIEGNIAFIEIIMQRELTVDEILIVGMSFQNGILRGIEEEEKKWFKKWKGFSGVHSYDCK